MKNILVISGFWPTKQNPISGIFVVQQVKALCNAGYSISVIVGNTIWKAHTNHLTPDELGLPADKVELIRVPILRLPEKLSANRLGFTLNVWSIGASISQAIKAIIRKSDLPEGCIIHDFRYFSLSARQWRQHIGCPTIAFVHGFDPLFKREFVSECIPGHFRRALPKIDKVILVGTSLKSHVLSLGIDESMISILPNGTEIPALSDTLECNLSEAVVISIISVSNLIDWKGIDDNLRALALLRHKHGIDNWTYTVVGDGPERQNLEHMAHELGIRDQTRFTGRLSYDQTMDEIAEADIFSLPSWGEAFGIVYLEAMARCKPVIGCFDNGAADIITDGADGMLVPPKSPDALALALQKLLENPELRIALGRQARTTAEGFTWDINASRVLKLLDLKEQDGTLTSNPS